MGVDNRYVAYTAILLLVKLQSLEKSTIVRKAWTSAIFMNCVYV